MSVHRPILFREWGVFKRMACSCGWVCQHRRWSHDEAWEDHTQHRWKTRAKDRAERLRKEAA